MTKKLVLLLVAMLAAVAVVAVLFVQDRYTFTVTFADAAGVREGQTVYYRDIAIGEVTRVAAGTPTAVDVRIGWDYAPKMHRQLAFFVERASLLGGERRLVAYDCLAVEAGAPIARGDVVRGSEGMLAWAACKAAASAGPWGGAAATLLNGLAASDSGKSIVGLIREASDSARRMGEREWETFRRDRLPALEREAAAYREQLEKSGKVEEARKFWAQFRAWVEQLAKR